MNVRSGARGKTIGRLSPCGEIFVEGFRHPARAEFGMLAPATPVVVVGSNEFGLVVRPMAENDPVGPEIDTGVVLPTPAEKIEERTEQTAEALERAREELRAYFVTLLVLPFISGAAFAGIGYWAGGDVWAVVGLFFGLVLGAIGLLKLFLAS